MDLIERASGTAPPVEEKTFVDPSRDPYEAERREQKLVHAYRDELIRNGHEVSRLKILPEGEAKPLFSDLYDATDNVLVEAKGSAKRGAVRMAIGQLLDYARFVSPEPAKVILLPSEPRTDLLNLCSTAGVRVTWPQDGGFAE